MPTKVYECDFCNNTTNENKKIMIQHEAECAYNPVNKDCCTCLFKTTEGALISGFWTGCSEGHEWLKVQDGDITCNFWKPAVKK